MTDEPFDPPAARSRRPLPLWVYSFERHTSELDADQVGGFMLLLMAMWKARTCDLADDELVLARVVRTSPTIWRRRYAPVLRPFFLSENRRFFSEKLQKEARFVESFLAAQSGKKRGKTEAKTLTEKQMLLSVDYSTVKSADKPQTNPIPYNHTNNLPPTPSDGDAVSFVVAVMLAVGVDPAKPPKGWKPPHGPTHIVTWPLALGLTEAEILHAVKASRTEHPEAPASPKALDRYLANVAAAKRQRNAAPNIGPITPEGAGRGLLLIAEALRAGRRVPPSALTPQQARMMLANPGMGVTEDMLRNAQITF